MDMRARLQEMGFELHKDCDRKGNCRVCVSKNHSGVIICYIPRRFVRQLSGSWLAAYVSETHIALVPDDESDGSRKITAAGAYTNSSLFRKCEMDGHYPAEIRDGILFIERTAPARATGGESDD